MQLSSSVLDPENGHLLRALAEEAQREDKMMHTLTERATQDGDRQGHYSYHNDLPSTDRGRKFLLHPIHETKARWRRPRDRSCGQLVDTGSS